MPPPVPGMRSQLQNHRVFERKLPKATGRGHVCLGHASRRPAPAAQNLGRGCVVDGYWPPREPPEPAAGPKCESTPTDATGSGGWNSTRNVVATTRRLFVLLDPSRGLKAPDQGLQVRRITR
ncbi:hypothetical protein HAX54_053063 [Datura stramonium]|uniref:Uncharacterized protein n=1 Tax=Datura stramonium TaxID=4076 RepID=A0ABS8WU23_DATST|nr:hypothetical protein [Datura stramonium]